MALRMGSLCAVKLRRLIRPIGLAMTAGQVLLLTRQHWQTIPPERRRRLRDLVRRSHGNPLNLSEAERAEMRELVRGLELQRLAIKAASVAVRGGRATRQAA